MGVLADSADGEGPADVTMLTGGRGMACGLHSGHLHICRQGSGVSWKLQAGSEQVTAVIAKRIKRFLLLSTCLTPGTGADQTSNEQQELPEQ